MGKRKRPSITITKVAIALAVVTTVLAMIASGSIVLSGGRNFEEGIHQLSLGIMLIAYLFLIVVIMAFKPQPVVSLSVVEEDRFLLITPCDSDGFLVLDQAGVDATVMGSFSKMPKHRRSAIRIVVARDVSIPNSFSDSLALFPNLMLLDLQEAKVATEFWEDLEGLPGVTHVLATNAIASEMLRNISISLPEVRFWLDKPRNLVIRSRASMNAPGWQK
jgi:hypothetical protein